MEDKLTREEVLHVARLARVGLSEADIERYRVQLKQLMSDVEKIKDIVNYDEEMIIAPTTHNTVMRDDVVGNMLSIEQVMSNVPKKNGNFVEVPVMINE